jgi:hypothetical protein
MPRGSFKSGLPSILQQQTITLQKLHGLNLRTAGTREVLCYLEHSFNSHSRNQGRRSTSEGLQASSLQTPSVALCTSLCDPAIAGMCSLSCMAVSTRRLVSRSACELPEARIDHVPAFTKRSHLE